MCGKKVGWIFFLRVYDLRAGLSDLWVGAQNIRLQGCRGFIRKAPDLWPLRRGSLVLAMWGEIFFGRVAGLRTEKGITSVVCTDCIRVQFRGCAQVGMKKKKKNFLGGGG